MHECRAKMGENGRVVIPMAFRKELKIKAGEELVLRVENNEIHVMSLRQAIEKTQAVVKKYVKTKSLVARLKEMRKEDAKNE